MTSTIQEIQNIIYELNVEIFNDDISDFSLLEFHTDGFAVVITFLDAIIWSSENDNRICIDEEKEIYEDLKLLLIREIIILSEKTNKIAKSLKNNYSYLFKEGKK